MASRHKSAEGVRSRRRIRNGTKSLGTLTLKLDETLPRIDGLGSSDKNLGTSEESNGIGEKEAPEVGEASDSRSRRKRGHKLTDTMELLRVSENIQPKSRIESPKDATLWELFADDLGFGDDVEEVSDDYSIQSQRVWNFLRLIVVLEQLHAYGLCITCRVFLSYLTILPVRFIIRVVTSLKRLELNIKHRKDFVTVFLLATCFVSLGWLNFGRLYHRVRAQSFMKLYVLYNMLQIFAKLFAALGEDLLDALYGYCKVKNDSAFRFIVTLGVTALYMVAHAYFLCVQIITLNVSVNSNDKSLIVILVSTQFVELKSSVFKKFGHKNLFQLACSDVVERFEIFVFFVILTIQNSSAIGIGTVAAWEWLSKACYVGMILLVTEVIVDWLKHGFIIKFNMIDPGIYEVFHLILCGDVVRESKRPVRAPIPSLRTIQRRFGLTPLPLSAVFLRVVWDAISPHNRYTKILAVVMTLVIIWILKITLKIHVLRHARSAVFLEKSTLSQDPKTYTIHTPSSKVLHRGKFRVKAEEDHKSDRKFDQGIGIISGKTAEKFTSMYPDRYRPVDPPGKLEHVARYAYYEGRVP